MKVKVIETGRIDILELRNASGQDNLSDIIGDHGAFGDDTSCQFSREWDEDDELSEEHGSEAVYEAISGIDGDLQDATEERIATLKEVFGE